jgi:hypothetical protein
MTATMQYDQPPSRQNALSDLCAQEMELKRQSQAAKCDARHLRRRRAALTHRAALLPTNGASAATAISAR